MAAQWSNYIIISVKLLSLLVAFLSLFLTRNNDDSSSVTTYSIITWFNVMYLLIYK